MKLQHTWTNQAIRHFISLQLELYRELSETCLKWSAVAQSCAININLANKIEGRTAEVFRKACVASLPTTERQGLLFVYSGKPENATKTKVPIVEPLEESPDGWVCLNTFRDLPYDALTLLENVLDASHVSYTHHRSVGNRANAAPVELEVIESGRQGFRGTIFARFPFKFLPSCLLSSSSGRRAGTLTSGRTQIKCASCRPALANIQRLRMWSAVTAGFTWATAVLLALAFGKTAVLAVALSSAAILACGATWFGLGKLEKQFYNGRDVPLRNLPEKK